MIQPILNDIQSSRDFVDAFAGYNHNSRISEAEVYDERNMSSDLFPLMSTRKLRAKFREKTGDDEITGVIAKDYLWYTKGTSIYCCDGTSDTAYDLGLDSDTQKSLVSMGAYIVIMPDKKFINTVDRTDYGSMQVDWMFDDSTVTYLPSSGETNLEWRQAFYACDEDGEPIFCITSATEPELSQYERTVNTYTYYVNKVGGYTAPVTTIEFDGGTVSIDALKDHYINISGFVGKVTGNTATSITFTPAYEYAVANDTEITVVETEIIEDKYWADVSDEEPVLKRYFSTQNTWSPVTAHMRINARNIAHKFEKLKTMQLQTHHPANLYGLKEQYKIEKAVLDDATIGNTGLNDYLVVGGTLAYNICVWETFDGYYYYAHDRIANYIGYTNEPSEDDFVYSNDYFNTDSFMNDPCYTMSNDVPTLDFVIECNNRLWGCRYGTDTDGNFFNEIYASSLGSFLDWNVDFGISTGSYTASCGTDGRWTGAITYNGYPTFFKEKHMYRVYGSQPSSFQLDIQTVNGVQEGSHDSLAIVNNVLFYKGIDGVYYFDGSIPAKVSNNLGSIQYTDASAGALNTNYYISMKDSLGTWHLFVFDTYNKVWHKQDNTQATKFSALNGDLLYIENGNIISAKGNGTAYENRLEWMSESGELGLGYIDKKYVSKVNLRMALGVGSTVMVYIQYDSSGAWDNVATVTGVRLTSFDLPVKPKRCDHFKIKLLGYGEAKIYSISKTIEQGSDM